MHTTAPHTMYNFVTIAGKVSPQKVHWKNTSTYTKNCDSYVTDVAWDFHLKVISPSTKLPTGHMEALNV